MALRQANSDLVVFYVRNGRGYAKAAAVKVRQTKATKQSAKLFGKSKRIGSFLRGENAALLPHLNNGQIMPRFDNALLQWLGVDDMKGYKESLQYLDRFEFNSMSELHGRFKQAFGVDFNDKGKIHLTIPGFDVPSDIGAPAHTADLEWHGVASSYNIAENSPYGSVLGYVQTPFVRGTVAPQNVSLDFDIRKGTLTVVVVALRYVVFRKGKTAVVDEPAWLPTAVVGCCYNG